MTLEKVRGSVLDSSSCVAGTEASERRAGAHTPQKIPQDPLRWSSMIVNLTWVRGFRVIGVWGRSCFYGGLIRQRRSGMWVALSPRLTFHFKGESRGGATGLLACFLTSGTMWPASLLSSLSQWPWALALPSCLQLLLSCTFSQERKRED